MTKRFPKYDSDEAVKRFVAEVDLVDYDCSDMKPVCFEFMAHKRQLLIAPSGQSGNKGTRHSKAGTR